MLVSVRTPTRIPHEPSLIAPIESAPGSRIAAAIRHDATDHNPLDRRPFQHIAQIRIEKSVIRILRHDTVILCYFLNLRDELPVLAARSY